MHTTLHEEIECRMSQIVGAKVGSDGARSQISFFLFVQSWLFLSEATEEKPPKFVHYLVNKVF